MRSIFTVILAALVAGAAFAQPPKPDPEPLPLPLPPPPMPQPVPLNAPKALEQPKPEEIAAISKLMREMALKNMAEPLVKANDGWGKQKEFAVGRVMLRNTNRVAPELPRAMFNDGLWRRFSVSARDPEKNFAIGITEMTRVEAEKMHVTINVAMDVNFRMEQQLWKRGLELYSGETRGHCKVGLQLKVTVTHKMEFKPGSLVPDVLLKINATDAKLSYDKVVIDHTAGLDGEDARAVGELFIDLVKAVKPDLEKDLLERGNAAIVKAVSNKEIKLELDKLMKNGAMPKK